MNKIDLEHKLLKGSPIYVDDIPIYSVTLGDMVDYKYGYTVCQQVIEILCLDDDVAGKMLSDDVEHTTWNFITSKIYYELYLLSKNNDLYAEVENLFIATIPLFLEMLFKEKVKFDQENGFFTIGDEQKLSNENFNRFRDIIKARNCLTDLDTIKNADNPADEFTRSLIEKRNKARQRLKKEKRLSDASDLTMADLISIFAESEHKTLQEVYKNYDIYQFNNQFNRLKIMEDYQVSIKALLAGAKSEDIDLQHWLSKIKKQED